MCSIQKCYTTTCACVLVAIVSTAMTLDVPMAMTMMGTTNMGSKTWLEKSIMLSAFFWGSLAAQIGITQKWAEKNFNNEDFIVWVMWFNSIVCWATPWASSDTAQISLLRFLQGASLVYIGPCIRHIINKLGQNNDNQNQQGKYSWFSIAINIGVSLGNAMAIGLVGVFPANDMNWKISFYVLGALGFATMLYPIRNIQSTAILFKNIFIVTGVTSILIIGLMIPGYIAIIVEGVCLVIYLIYRIRENFQTCAVSLPVGKKSWLVGANFAQSWAYVILIMEIPNYFDKLMGFSMTETVVYSTLPHLIQAVLNLCLGFLVTFPITNYEKELINTIFSAIGTLIPGVLVLIVSFLKLDSGILVGFLTCAVALNAALNYGLELDKESLLQIPERFHGIVEDPSNILLGTISFIVMNLMSNEMMWNLIFIASAILYLISGLCYCFYYRGFLYERAATGDSGPSPQQNTETSS